MGIKEMGLEGVDWIRLVNPYPDNVENMVSF
jgi:hypothetical protein